MEDGSGLSARNYITPNLLSGYLAKFVAKQSPAYAASLLPEAGSQGTVRRLLKTLMPGAYLDEKWFAQQNHFLHRPDADKKQQAGIHFPS